jgi:hypothetical protein
MKLSEFSAVFKFKFLFKSFGKSTRAPNLLLNSVLILKDFSFSVKNLPDLNRFVGLWAE